MTVEGRFRARRLHRNSGCPQLLKQCVVDLNDAASCSRIFLIAGIDGGASTGPIRMEMIGTLGLFGGSRLGLKIIARGKEKPQRAIASSRRPSGALRACE
jgi:hypothetical protein